MTLICIDDDNKKQNKFEARLAAHFQLQWNKQKINRDSLEICGV